MDLERTQATPAEAERDSLLPPTQAAVLGGRYRLEGMLGSGGMGSVYLAHDLELGEKVAVKMLHSRGARDDLFMDRMRSEVRLARRVTHPNVARTYDIGEHDGSRFLTMEYVGGESLGARVVRLGPFDVPTFLGIATDLTSALSAAHDAGVLHRDLKPQNILLTETSAKIADFGAAWPLDEAPAGVVIGTPSYMAPEQFTAAFDRRSDIFGLGAVFYTMLTGMKPFGAVDSARPLRPPNPCDVRPDVPLPLGSVVARCLEPVPENRYVSAGALRDALIDAKARLADDELVPTTIVNGPADRLLLALEGAPRYLRLRAVAEDAEGALAIALRDEVADCVNELAGLHAAEGDGHESEATAELRVVQEEGGITLYVRLVSSREGLEFWSGSFHGDRGNAVALARGAASRIERALSVETPRLSATPPMGLEAQELYLRGRAAYRAFWPESVKIAARSFEEALPFAPAHPLILASLAMARARLCLFLETTLEHAKKTSDLALKSAPDLAEAHAARGSVHLLEMDAEGATSSLLDALEKAPGHADTLTLLSGVVLEAGAPGDAIRLATAASRRRGGDEALVHIARAHALLGRTREADDALSRMHPKWAMALGSVARCRFLLWRGDTAEAARVVARHLGGAGEAPTSKKIAGLLGKAMLDGRSPREDEDFMRRMTSPASPPRTRAFLSQLCAEMEACIGDWGQVHAALERSIEDGLFDALWFDRCPLLDPLRGTARFEACRDAALGRARRVRARFYGSLEGSLGA